MNPAIEKLMEARESEKRAEEEKKKETDISDEQMVQWQKMRTKFNATHKQGKPQHKDSKDEPVKKKPKFIKPLD